MSSAVAVDERVSRTPPRPVSSAVWLMWLALALGVAAVVTLGFDDVTNAFGERDDEFGSLVETLIIAGCVLVAAAVALWALLTIAVRRGRNWARVTTWVVAPIVAAALLVWGATQSASGFVVATVVLLAGICLLLARPESRAYFRGHD